MECYDYLSRMNNETNNKMSNLSSSQEFQNHEGEVLTILSVTNDSYPTQRINGAFVNIKTSYNEGEQWMSIESIYNFIEN